MKTQMLNDQRHPVTVRLGSEWDTYGFPAERTDGQVVEYFRCHFPAHQSTADKLQILARVIQDLIISDGMCGGAA